MRAAVPLIVSLILGGLLPAAAHHTFIAQYDPDQPVVLTGVVTRVEWTNPHARIYLDVPNEDGSATNWNLELASPNVLRRVTVDGTLARDGSKMANALSITLPGGRKIFARETAPVLQ